MPLPAILIGAKAAAAKVGGLLASKGAAGAVAAKGGGSGLLKGLLKNASPLFSNLIPARNPAASQSEIVVKMPTTVPQTTQMAPSWWSRQKMGTKIAIIVVPALLILIPVFIMLARKGGRRGRR